ncbi:MAG: hypothetical protein RJA19_481 [Bacteroidota bacterium]|jgi:hypothetical protein
MANEKKATTPSDGFAMGKSQFVRLGLGILLLIAGYLLMSGGKSEDPEVFNPEIFNNRRLVVAPIVVLLGYATVFHAILKR